MDNLINGGDGLTIACRKKPTTTIESSSKKVELDNQLHAISFEIDDLSPYRVTCLLMVTQSAV